MAGLVWRFDVGRKQYRQPASARLCRSLFRVSALLAFSLSSGCSTSYQLGHSAPKEDEKLVHTASVVPAVRSGPPAGWRLPPDADLAYAKIAAAEVLSRGAKDSSQSWENPKSGAHGTITPLADAYPMDGALCRDFIASHVNEGSESWMQGEACREGKGKWEIRRLKPWRRT